MDKIKLLETLKTYPLFTFNDFIRITKKKKEYVRTLLYRLRKQGLIYKIEKEKYTLYDDPIIFASYIQIPSYISFWTALRFYNFTEQLPRTIMVASPKSRKEIIFLETKIKFIKIKNFFGYKKERYRDFNIFIGEKEKVIIDCFLIKSVPLDEVIKAIESKELDKNKLIKYAIMVKNKSLIKRIGYLMENLGYECKKLEKHIDNNYIPLDSTFNLKGKRNKKWKIIVNRKIR